MIIQNSQGEIDTVIAYSNEQVIELNKRGVLLNHCVDYVEYQDSVISSKEREIDKLVKIIKTSLKNDSLSRETIKLQEKEFNLALDQVETYKQLYKQEIKDNRKVKIKNILFDVFLKTPLTVSVGVGIGYLIAK